MKTGLALDRTARTVDAQGFLHVKDCNISKACVNPYWGSEIPDAQELGLDPKKVYYLLRDPKELEKAAATFNNLPLMDFHKEVSADGLEDDDTKNKVVGTTGGNAHYEHPYLINDITVWAAGAIEGVDSKQQTELSCAYRYKLDMTPGEYEGTKYDGRMYDIAGNHVALVDEGRAGKDVVVKDQKPKGIADKLMVKIDFSDVIKTLQDASAKVADGGPEVINPVIDELTKLKALITEKLKPGADEETAKALDDCTAAIDIAVHHLLDVKEDDAEEQVGGVSVEDDALNETGGVSEEADDANPEGKNQYTAGLSAAKTHHEAMQRHHEKKHSELVHKATHGGVTEEELGKLQSHKHAAQQHREAAANYNYALRNPHPDGTRSDQHHTLKGWSNAANTASSKANDEKPGGVSVEDANPEGKNQYSGAAGAARMASTGARLATKDTGERKFGQSRSRQEQRAASAHAHAAELHSKAAALTSSQTQKGYHHSRAEEHKKAGEHHQSRANAMQSVGDTTFATDVISHVEGHKDSSGAAAPWVIKSEKTGEVIWSGASKEAAEAQLRNIEGHKGDGVSVEEDANPQGVNQYTGGGEGAKKDAKSQARMHTNAAMSATAVAASSGSKEDHQRAMKAHEKAKESNRAAGNHKQADLHSSHVVYHDRESSPVQKSRIFNYTNGKDANPQGVNQYTGGGGSSKSPSATAGSFSARAIKSGDPAHHDEASAAHAHAATKAASPAVKSWHESMANAHEAASRGVPVKFGKNFGDHPKVSSHDANPEGVNQYTGGGNKSVNAKQGMSGGNRHSTEANRASIAAKEKSRNARATGTPAAHLAAHQQHKLAQAQHEAARKTYPSGSNGARAHANAAEHHSNIAAMHFKKYNE